MLVSRAGGKRVRDINFHLSQLHLARLGHDNCWIFSPLFDPLPNPVPNAHSPASAGFCSHGGAPPLTRTKHNKQRQHKKLKQTTSLRALEAAPSVGPSLYKSRVGGPAPPSSPSTFTLVLHSSCTSSLPWPYAPTGASSNGPRGPCARDGAPFGVSGPSAGCNAAGG